MTFWRNTMTLLLAVTLLTGCSTSNQSQQGAADYRTA